MLCRRLWLLVFPVLVSACPSLVFPQAQPGRALTDRPVSPQDHISLAGAHLKASWPYHEQYSRDRSWNRDFIRYLSFYSIPEADLTTYRRYLNWWIQQLSFERAVTLPVEVPGSHGRLCWIDLRWYGWTARAWEAVARREPYFREPWLLFEDTDYLRRQTGHTTGQLDKDGTRHALAIVRADWFIRETLESRRSPAYYDLLYSRWRFPERRWSSGGKNYVQDLPFVDFPKNAADLERVFGVDKLRAFAQEIKIDLDFGTIAAGGHNHRQTGSIVALSDRLIVIYPAPFGWYMRTFDALENTGRKDYAETLIFKDGKFIRGDGAKAEFDGGEILAYLPNGGQTGLLINAEEKRVETAVADLANDTSDRFLNQGVRNVGSCVVCHGPTGGFISPRDIEELDRRAGITRKFKDPKQEQRYREFFDDWREGAAGSTSRYEKLVEKTTAPPYKGFLDFAQTRPWTGANVAAMTLELRAAYDEEVTAARGARELGVPEGLFKYLCSRSPTHRLQQLLGGRPIPSRTWEVDSFKEVGLLLDAYRQRPDPQIQRLYGHY